MPITTLPLLTPSTAYKPFRFPWAFTYWQIQQQVHWMAEEVPLGEDCKDWAQNLTPAEKNLLTQIFRFFTQADIEVQNCYHDKYARIFQPTEIKMMLTAFSNMETVHIAAYSHLLDTVGMPESEYGAFMDYQEMRDKHDYSKQFGVSDHEETLKTLAMFGGFTEGVQLFASFAILMNFPRFNKMKGMGQIIAWSVRDECVSDDTEVLTPDGWLPFPDLKDGQQVAQFDPETAEISFVVPDRVVRKPYKGSLYTMDKRHISYAVTPNHDILYYRNGKPQKAKASDFRPHTRLKIPTTGWLDNSNMLTAAERLHIAFAADGHSISSENRTGERCGYVRTSFGLKKPHKIARIKSLADEAGWKWIEHPVDNSGQTKITVDFPYRPEKDLALWAKPSDFTGARGRDFINECLNWDGSVKNDRRIFCTTRPTEAHLLQAIAAMSGQTATMTITEDNRKDTYKDYYRISFNSNESSSTVHDGQTTIDYEGIVYCVSVPTGSFVTRRNNRVVMTGNSLHCEGIIRLFHEYAKESGALTPYVKRQILTHAEEVVMIEDRFIDLAFNMGPVEGCDASDIKRYVRFITNWRLGQLGLEPIFEGVDKHPLPWLSPLLNGVEHSNFFEQRSTEYSKVATRGNWSETWNMFDINYNSPKT